mgnify:CR=1 FL=1
MTCTTCTDLWNDSCSLHELTYAIEHGAVGATTNPVIVGNVLKKEMHLWSDRIDEIVRENPTSTEDEITWKVIEELAVKGAQQLLPAFARHQGKKGRLSIQTNPKYFLHAERIIEQALYFNTLAPNMQIKIPVSSAGIQAIEEVTYRGVNINATVSFSVPQAIAVADAIAQHHERLDGSGYPRGLSGDAIATEARILAVADVVEAMTSHRPYRPAQTVEDALAEIAAHRGTLYDAAAVDACIAVLRRDSAAQAAPAPVVPVSVV